jgi:hypothetical protein
VDEGDGVPIAGLRITQGSLRTAAQMTDLIEHVATGGDWSEAETAVQLVRFEDGELFLRDGHHRCVATLAAGRRAHLLPSEYVLEEWRYEQWSRPNLSLRPPFITPYDPRTEIRVSDLGAHRQAVQAVLEAEGSAAAKAYIERHRAAYLMPRGSRAAGLDTVGDLLAAWRRACLEEMEDWVRDCAAWRAAEERRRAAAQPALAAKLAGSAEAARRSTTPLVQPHFPAAEAGARGARSSCPRYPDSVELRASELRQGGRAGLQRASAVFAEEGYLVIKGMLTRDEVQASTERLLALIAGW